MYGLCIFHDANQILHIKVDFKEMEGTSFSLCWNANASNIRHYFNHQQKWKVFYCLMTTYSMTCHA